MTGLAGNQQMITNRVPQVSHRSEDWVYGQPNFTLARSIPCPMESLFFLQPSTEDLNLSVSDTLPNIYPEEVMSTSTLGVCMLLI
jgi:hypothetical protein